MRDAVSVASNERAKIALVIHVAVDGFVTEDHIRQLATAVRHLQRDHRATVVSDGNFSAAYVGQHIKIDRLAVRSLPEGFLDCGTEPRCCTNRPQSGHKQRSREDC